MSLLGRLLGRRRSRWEEDWRTFPGSLHDGAGLWVVDLGAIAAAPVGDLPVRLDVLAPYEAGVDGLPADPGTLAAQARAVTAAASGLGGAYVGLVASHGRSRLTAALPAEPAEAVIVAGLTQAEVSTAYDPHWAYVRDHLAPDDRQHQMLLDLSLLSLLTESGDPLTSPRPVTHGAAFADETSAQRAAVDLRAEGFAVNVQRDDEGDYSMEAVREDPVAAPGVHELSWSVREVIERHGGSYGGWSCPYVH
jgi:Regulator of ribonuclease activity B